MSVTARNRPLTGHSKQVRGKSDTYLTPPEIVGALGPFDLDPCCPPKMPWQTALTMLTERDDGLKADWGLYGRVWLNPPFGPDAEHWLKKLADHNNGIALVHARTETRWFHEQIWNRARSLLFFAGRLHFHDVKGNRLPFNAGAPSVLVAYGIQNAFRLRECGLAGRLIEL